MGARLREQFKCSLLRLEYSGRHEAFYTCQWQWPRPVFLLYRFIVASYVVSWNIYCYIVLPSVGDHPSIVFLTQWAYLLLAVYLAFAFVVVMCHACSDGLFTSRKAPVSKQNGFRVKAKARTDRDDNPSGVENQNINGSEADHKRESNECDVTELDSAECEVAIAGVPSVNSSEAPDSICEGALAWYLKLKWLLFDINIAIMPMISIIYFFVLYPYITRENPSYSAGALDINLHGISTVIVFLELALAALPVQLLHVVYPSCFGFAYVIFSVVYWALDRQENSLYPHILDWNYPWVTMGVLGGLLFVMVPLLQLCGFGFYRLRLLIFSKIYGHEYQ